MTKLEEKLNPFIDEARASIQNKNWYAALAIALTLPDICSTVESPNKKGRNVYIDWLKNNSQIIKTTQIEELSDVYALRCAFLHNGTAEITGQNAKKIIDSYIFTYDDQPGWKVNNNSFSGEKKILQINVSSFVECICQAADNWLNDNKTNEHVEKNSGEILSIIPSSSFIFG